MQALDHTIDSIADSGGSSDIGNVSAVVPTIHSFVAINSGPIAFHSAEFAVASGSDDGMKALIYGAKALAMTAADIILQPKVLSQIKDEFLNPKEL